MKKLRAGKLLQPVLYICFISISLNQKSQLIRVGPVEKYFC